MYPERASPISTIPYNLPYKIQEHLMKAGIYVNKEKKAKLDEASEAHSLSKLLVPTDQSYIVQNSDLCLSTLQIIKCHETLRLFSNRIKPPMLNPFQNWKKNLL